MTKEKTVLETDAPGDASPKWTSDDSSQLYGTNLWGSGIFRVNEAGHAELQLKEGGPKLDLYNLVMDLLERGIRPPILIRFPDIVKRRVELLSACFENAIREYGYQGRYSGVYPIKVNQQSQLLEEIVAFGQVHRLGLECGSKPELLVALALLDTPDAYIICNGFKDSEFIETAVLAQKLGRNTIVVVDRMAELKAIINVARKFDIQPQIGFRAKLDAEGAGKWVDSSGAKSKFGLTASEMVRGVEMLREAGLLESLRLLHFHIGSQIPAISSIKNSTKEAARFYTELHAMGAKPDIIDVGGGLGIDYDGSGRSDSSVNYSEQEYANDIVSIIQGLCDEKGVPHPNLVSESGRALVAHSSLLVFNVLGRNEIITEKIDFKVGRGDSRIVREMFEMYERVSLKNINEYFNDLMDKKAEISQAFTFGSLGLAQRAKAEDLYWSIAAKMEKITRDQEDFADIYWKLQAEMTDTYYCNFSVFQSLPDAWAVNQIFPVMPLHRLDERPTRRATIADLTCDSDGKLDIFIDSDGEGPQNYLEVHEVKDTEPYFLGVFLAGAYQETLGDLHNLFGDTDAVHISLTEDGYTIDHVVDGDTVASVLNFVEYHTHELVEKIRKTIDAAIGKNALTRVEGRLLLKHYEQGLAGYTYLEDIEEPTVAPTVAATMGPNSQTKSLS